MSLTGRRGFSLIELLIALVTGSLLSALVFATVARVHHVARSRSERAGLVATLRNVVFPIAHELESAGLDSVAGPDLAALTSTDVVVRAHRGVWAVCHLVLPDTIVVLAGGAAWIARQPVPGRDSLLLYLPGDSASMVDAWLPLPLLAGPRARACPSGAAGVELVSTLDSAAAQARGATAPSVLRSFETVAYRLYGGGSVWQFGAQGLSGGGAIQPIAGPLGASGVGLAGLDAALAPAASLPNVHSIAVHAAGSTVFQSAVGPGRVPPATDSVALISPLRNVP